MATPATAATIFVPPNVAPMVPEFTESVIDAVDAAPEVTIFSKMLLLKDWL